MHHILLLTHLNLSTKKILKERIFTFEIESVTETIYMLDNICSRFLWEQVDNCYRNTSRGLPWRELVDVSLLGSLAETTGNSFSFVDNKPCCSSKINERLMPSDSRQDLNRCRFPRCYVPVNQSMLVLVLRYVIASFALTKTRMSKMAVL